MSTTNENDKATTTAKPTSPLPEGKSEYTGGNTDFPDPTQGDSGSSGSTTTKPQ